MSNIYEELPNIFNVAAYLFQNNLTSEKGDKIAFCYRDKTYSYSQLISLVKRSASLFSELGLERENRLGILLPDRPEMVAAFLGAIWLGAIPVPINPACSLEDINYILQDSRIKILLTSQAWQDKLMPIPSPYLQKTLLVDGERSFFSCLEEQSEQIDHAETARDEAAFWLYTSGSTGRPKGVIHAHQSIVVCARQYGQILSLNSDDVVYSVASMAFAYGLGNSLYLPMAFGATSILSDANNAFNIIDDLHRYQPTVFFGIPSVYAAILELEEISPLDSSSLRLCISAAEQLPKNIWEKWWTAHQLEICEGIGTSEFLYIFLSNQPGKIAAGSSGLPLPGYEVQIINENGFVCGDGEIGELRVSGDSLMLGYWNRLQQTRQAIYGKGMKTGDKYKRDRDGFFWFMGRADDLFKVNGQWISPLEIEEVLHRHSQVYEVAIVPETKNGKQLTEIVAYIRLKDNSDSISGLERNIFLFAKQQLPHFKAPKRIHFVNSLPRTSTGKINRQLLRQKQLDFQLSISH